MSTAVFLVRFLPAVFVFSLAGFGYWLTSGGTQLPSLPKASGSWSSGSWFAGTATAAAELAPESALFELFRFDASPKDLGDRWRKQPGGKDGQAYKATLEPGDLAIDLTGSVLYHFTKKGQLKRVVLAGTTTEPMACAEYARDAFGFEVSDSTEHSAVMKGTADHRGQLRLAQLSRTNETDPLRYRVEWTVER